MDLEKYIASTAVKIRKLKELFPSTTLEIKEFASQPSGVFKSVLKGQHERIGYTLHIEYEYFELLRDGTLQKKYRYRIRRGQDELMRFQSARGGYEENAHFPPLFTSESGNHFGISKWPADLQDMNFHTIFQFYLNLVRADGELPLAFRHAKP